jgi:GTPase SAR1 family protein
MNNFYNFIDKYNLNNGQNHRYLIIGSSGSGKTSLAISLILSELPRHKKIIFIIGGENLLLHKLKKDFEENNIEIEIHIINTLKDIENLNINPSPNELVVLDDLSHLIKNSQKLMTLINKIYTASRQSKYNVILILHKLKMFNNMVRQNSTKIFITSITKEILDEFDELKNVPINTLKKNLPLMIDLSNDKIGGYIVKELSFDKIKFDKNLPVITKDMRLKNEYSSRGDFQYKKKDPDVKKNNPTKTKEEISSGIKNAITTSSNVKKKLDLSKFKSYE